jgi:heme oxygenase
MTAAELAAETLAAQELESLAACVARGQSPDSYQDIVVKIRGHVEKLPLDRRFIWIDQCLALGVTLFPSPEKTARLGTITSDMAAIGLTAARAAKKAELK